LSETGGPRLGPTKPCFYPQIPTLTLIWRNRLAAGSSLMRGVLESGEEKSAQIDLGQEHVRPAVLDS